MNANVTFRHMDSSPALREYAVGKLERVVSKYVDGRVDATVVMSVEKFRHIATFRVQIKNLMVKGDSSSEDMYSSVDLALDKIERQLRRHKDRLRDYKPGNATKGRQFSMSVILPNLDDVSEYEDDEFAQDYEQADPAATPEEQAEGSDDNVEMVQTAKGEVEVKRQQNYETREMSLEEAVMQLSLMEDREFFVFTNAASHDINIVYRRADKTIGLIET